MFDTLEFFIIQINFYQILKNITSLFIFTNIFSKKSNFSVNSKKIIICLLKNSARKIFDKIFYVFHLILYIYYLHEYTASSVFGSVGLICF